jgi:hypothetical protein
MRGRLDRIERKLDVNTRPPGLEDYLRIAPARLLESSLFPVQLNDYLLALSPTAARQAVWLIAGIERAQVIGAWGGDKTLAPEVLNDQATCIALDQVHEDAAQRRGDVLPERLSTGEIETLLRDRHWLLGDERLLPQSDAPTTYRRADRHEIDCEGFVK